MMQSTSKQRRILESEVSAAWLVYEVELDLGQITTQLLDTLKHNHSDMLSTTPV